MPDSIRTIPTLPVAVPFRPGLPRRSGATRTGVPACQSGPDQLQEELLLRGYQTLTSACVPRMHLITPLLHQSIANRTKKPQA